MGNMISIRKGIDLHTPHEGTISARNGRRKPKRQADGADPPCRWPLCAAIRARIVSKAEALVRFPGDSVAEDSLWIPWLLAYAPNRYPIRFHGAVHPRNRRRHWRTIHEFRVGHQTNHQFHLLLLMLGPGWPELAMTQ